MNILIACANLLNLLRTILIIDFMSFCVSRLFLIWVFILTGAPSILSQDRKVYEILCKDTAFSVDIPRGRFRNKVIVEKGFELERCVVYRPGYKTGIHKLTKDILEANNGPKLWLESTDSIDGYSRIKSSFIKTEFRKSETLKEYSILQCEGYDEFVNGRTEKLASSYPITDHEDLVDTDTWNVIMDYSGIIRQLVPDKKSSYAGMLYELEVELQNFSEITWTGDINMRVYAGDCRIVIKHRSGFVLFDKVTRVVSRVTFGAFESSYSRFCYKDQEQVEFKTNWNYGAFFEAILEFIARDSEIASRMNVLSNFYKTSDLKNAFSAKNNEEFNASAMKFYSKMNLPSASPKKKVKLEDFAEAIFQVHQGDRLTTGFFISKEGHAIINKFNTDSDSIVPVIINHKGDTLKYEIIRTDEEYKVHLVKINTVCQTHFIMSAKPVDLLTSVYLYSAPFSEEFTQIISNGIIGAKKFVFGNDFFQADIKYNMAGIGGPVFTADGSVIGIMRGKFVGTEVEAITLLGPSYLIMENLRIGYP